MELINNNVVVYENRKAEYNLCYHPETTSYSIDITFVRDDNRIGVRSMITETQLRYMANSESMMLCYVDGVVRQLREEYLKQYGSVINIHKGPFKSFVESMQSDILKLKSKFNRES